MTSARALRLLGNGIAAVALIVFAWLCLRHYTESVFLEDQVNQLQNFEALLQLKPQGLWGGVMSDTQPPVRTFGPLGAVVFGLSVSLGLGIDGIHAVTSLLIAIATAAAFIALLRIDPVFAWIWFWIFASIGLVWWNAGLLWTNTLLLPTGLALLAAAASCLHRPTLARLVLLFLTVLFALQLHLAAIVVFPVVVVVAVMAARDAAARKPGRGTRAVLVALAIVACAPYAIAEAQTAFANTRAVFADVTRTTQQPSVRRSATFAQTLALAIDPVGLAERAGARQAVVIGAGVIMAAAALLLLKRREQRSLWGLTVASVAAIVGQALFFLWTNRELAGNHYVTVLSPFYAITTAALLRSLLFPRSPSPVIAAVLGGACVVFLVWTGPARADRFMPSARWSYGAIVAALDGLCDGGGVDTAEGPGFAAVLDPAYDGVLRYLMNRGFSRCRYEPGSDVLIAANRDGAYEPEQLVGTARYRLDIVEPPGVARYRRAAKP